jgi:hypothetical protein
LSYCIIRHAAFAFLRAALPHAAALLPAPGALPPPLLRLRCQLLPTRCQTAFITPLRRQRRWRLFAPLLADAAAAILLMPDYYIDADSTLFFADILLIFFIFIYFLRFFTPCPLFSCHID